ncbi:phosphatidylinositol kinase [Fadolivirus algeromassiliense]|uniref:Phosphatidylinositol kinase n=1 Tax=Fadolivirus FV1/VV64 TaxID=3070911 RepID=A0A7D3UVW4_9VIRU|nr:phosphatidylinositol kinase [Fadolivirus algeromassiliense]QKF94394.1 phosphatidylinositol kinase [Fadolivirus FV1/VV64]
MGDRNIEMAYSVFLEQKHEENREPLRYTLPRRVYKWVEDDAVTSCYNCSKTFSLLLRKHHCRFCGRIFCADCTNHVSTIPKDLLSDDSKKGSWNEYLSSYVFTKDPTKYKVCKGCKDTIDFIESVRKIIELLVILNLDIKQLKLVGKLCKQWHHASNYILSIFREIQYKLPNDTFTELEKKLLWGNINYINGHNRYMVQLIRSCSTPDEYEKAAALLKKKRTVNCWSMLCGRNCNMKLTSFDSINLLTHSFKQIGHNDILRKCALEHLICSDKELKCYLPLLVYYIRYDNGHITDFLVNRCINNFTLLNSLYWELQLYPKDGFHEDAYSNILTKLKELFKEKKHENNFVTILEGYSLVKTFETISKAISEENKQYEDIKDKFILKGALTSPLNNTSKVKSLHIEKIKIKNSATRPMIIPCEVQNGSIVNVLYKKEDVRRDQIMMNMIHIADLILKKEENLDLGLITYNILPTTKTSGMIEIVDEAETMYYIQEKLKTSVLNYVFEFNGDLKIKEVRDTFIKSVAGYSVITYLFGVGDRHLDNIMVSKNGKLFHIDYGYIFGADPVVSNPGIRMTPEIIEALGGLSSRYYATFTELCSRIYNCLRRHIDIFISMSTILPKLTEMKVTDDDIYKLLINRFLPGENNNDATLHFISQIEKQNYIDKIKDWCHYHSREGTVSSAMNRLSYAMSTLITQNFIDDKSSKDSVNKSTKV